MKVFFGTTSKEISTHIADYRLIRSSLIELGCVVLFDWLERAVKKSVVDPKGKRHMKENIAKITQAINECDFVVVEYTVPNFSNSHQIMYALQRRKPTLVLRKLKDNSYSDTYIESLNSDLLKVKDYDHKSLNSILKEFIGFQAIGQKFSRYNLILSNKHKYYLDWAAEEYSSSKSELVRDALDSKILNDAKFRTYIGGD